MSRCTLHSNHGFWFGRSGYCTQTADFEVCLYSNRGQSSGGPEATWNRFSGSCSRGLRRDTAGAGTAQLEVLHSNHGRTFSETSFAI
jgi:hypothetical protein